jgi:DNA gyrase subunit B
LLNAVIYISLSYKVQKGKKESYIKDDASLEKYLIEQSINNAILSSGSQIFKESEVLASVSAYYALRRGVTRLRKRFDSEILMAIVSAEILFKEEFSHVDASLLSEKLNAYLAKKAAHCLPISVEKVEAENEETRFVISSQRDGVLVKTMINPSAIKTVEFKELLRNYNLSLALGAGPFKMVKGAFEQSFDSFEEFAAYIENSSRKGQSIQRYKGLGEMNPKQLWETTMDPKERTLLRVNIEDVVEADTAFSNLMGDEVEPRRLFIEQVALDCFNLDI